MVLLSDKHPIDLTIGQELPPTFHYAWVILFASSTFGEVVTGDFNVDTEPSVVSLASKAVFEDRIRAYMRCLAVSEGRFTPEQAAYFDIMAAFLTTEPSPEEFLQWQSENPFPSSGSGGQPSSQRFSDEEPNLAFFMEWQPVAELPSSETRPIYVYQLFPQDIPAFGQFHGAGRSLGSWGIDAEAPGGLHAYHSVLTNFSEAPVANFELAFDVRFLVVVHPADEPGTT